MRIPADCSVSRNLKSPVGFDRLRPNESRARKSRVLVKPGDQADSRSLGERGDRFADDGIDAAGGCHGSPFYGTYPPEWKKTVGSCPLTPARTFRWSMTTALDFFT